MAKGHSSHKNTNDQSGNEVGGGLSRTFDITKDISMTAEAHAGLNVGAGIGLFGFSAIGYEDNASISVAAFGIIGTISLSNQGIEAGSIGVGGILGYGAHIQGQVAIAFDKNGAAFEPGISAGRIFGGGSIYADISIKSEGVVDPNRSRNESGYPLSGFRKGEPEYGVISVNPNGTVRTGKNYADGVDDHGHQYGLDSPSEHISPETRRAADLANDRARRAADPYGSNDDRHFGGADASGTRSSSGDRSPNNTGRADRDQQGDRSPANGGPNPSRSDNGYNSSGPGAARGSIGDNGGGNFGTSTSNPGRTDRDQQGGRSASNPGRADRDQQSGRTPTDRTATEGRRPVILDLEGNGFDIDALSASTFFVDMNGDGHGTRTAWAGRGTGVLVIDADGDGKISQEKEFAFTKWDANATSDLQAIQTVFDTNHNGRLDAGDARWAEFKVWVDGQLVTLAALGITSIELTPSGSGQSFADGSVIARQTAFTRTKPQRSIRRRQLPWRCATHAQIHVTTGTNLESTDQLLKAAGAKCVGGTYVV